MTQLHPCCRPHRPCSRMNPTAALAHAAWRSRLTGQDQDVRHFDGEWRITEAPRRRRKDPRS